MPRSATAAPFEAPSAIRRQCRLGADRPCPNRTAAQGSVTEAPEFRVGQPIVLALVVQPLDPAVSEHPHIVRWLLGCRRNYIGQLEILAAVAAYFSVPELRGRRVLHWVDNTSAVAALTKGQARAPDSVTIVHAFKAHCLRIHRCVNLVSAGAFNGFEGEYS